MFNLKNSVRSANSEKTARMIKANAIRVISGYVEGVRQPSLSVQLLLPNNVAKNLLKQKLLNLLGSSLLAQHLNELKANREKKMFDTARTIAITVDGLMASAGFPVLESFKISSVPKKQESNHHTFNVLFPSYEPRAVVFTLKWILKTLNNQDSRQKSLPASLRKELDQLLGQLRKIAPFGTNNIRFINAAHLLGIPVLPLPGDVFQYGWGIKGRWFHSSITDETNAIGVKQAKNKLVTNAFLKQGGIPVALGMHVNNPAEALSAAKKIGYPVVVKPADLDQGKGVYADLRNPQEVHNAFEQAKKLSSIIMLEEHLKGIAFRITLVRGETISIVKRLPAGITGDGMSTIQSLIEKTNEDPRRSARHFSIMKQIVIDSEAQNMLEREGLNLDSVPMEGEFIALKRSANVSTGGDAITLEAEEIDSSYIDMAKRAADLLRLDIAAVDFITNDIHKPLQETRTAVIEVNAQPQMGTILTHLHEQILKSYVDGDGTIPSLLVFGSNTADLIGNVRERLSGSNPGLGTISSEGVFIGKEMIDQYRQSMLNATRSLLLNRNVSALFLAIDHVLLMKEGLPLPIYHHLVITSWPEKQAVSAQVLSRLGKHLLGDVWIEKSHPLQKQIHQILGPERIRVFESKTSMHAAIDKALGVNTDE